MIRGKDDNKKRMMPIIQYKPLKLVWMVLCSIFLIAMLVVYAKSAVENVRVDQVLAAQNDMESEFRSNKDKNIKEPIRQNDDCPGVVLINTGNNDTDNISSNDIQNISVVVFERNATKGIINVVALQKETLAEKGKNNHLIKLKDLFDTDDPQPFYDAIEKSIDYKVDSYIVYNSETVGEIMDIRYIMNLNVMFAEQYGINDVLVLNKTQKKYANRYPSEIIKQVDRPGMQSLNKLQTVAYVNMYADIWDCGWNDWRQLGFIIEEIRGIKECNFDELERVKHVLLKNPNDLDNDKLIKIAAAIRTYRIGVVDRWPQWTENLKFKKEPFVFPLDNKKCLAFLHKARHLEKGYKLSEKALQYCAECKKAISYIAAIKKKQAEKKALEKKEKTDSANALNNNYNNNTYNNKSDNSSKKTTGDKEKDNSKKSQDNESTDSNPQVEPAEPNPEPQPEPEVPQEEPDTDNPENGADDN